MNDYLSVLREIPHNHSGLIFEQLWRGSASGVVLLRTFGLPLPGDTKIPNQLDVHTHLSKMANVALDVYFNMKASAKTQHVLRSDEVWGEDSDDLFTLTVTGLGPTDSEGYTIDIELNLLYRGNECK